MHHVQHRKVISMGTSEEDAMTATRLKELCSRLYGSARWQTALAQELRVNDRTVRRWASGTARIPHPVALCVKLMVFLDELSWLGEWRQTIQEDL